MRYTECHDLKVLIIEKHYPPYTIGGTSTYTKLLAEELSKHGIYVTVVTSSPRKVIYESPKQNLRIIRLPIMNVAPRDVWFQLINWKAILKLIEKHGYDLVHANNLNISLIGDKITKLRPLIVTLHGSPDALLAYYVMTKFKDKLMSVSLQDLGYYAELPLIKHLYVRDLMFSSALIYVAKHVYKEALRYCPKESVSEIRSKSFVIYTWIDIKEIQNIVQEQDNKHGLREKSKVQIGLVGRLFLAKGITFALKAFDIIVNEMGISDLELKIFGKGPMLSWILHFIKKHKLKNKVKLYSYIPREKLLKTLSTIDVLLFPSLYEGCPYALLEANALGIPVVTFKLPWSTEFVVDKVNGFKAPFPDLHKLSEMTIKALSLNRRNVKNYAKKFDIKKLIKYILNIYEKLA